MQCYHTLKRSSRLQYINVNYTYLSCFKFFLYIGFLYQGNNKCVYCICLSVYVYVCIFFMCVCVCVYVCACACVCESAFSFNFSFFSAICCKSYLNLFMLHSRAHLLLIYCNGFSALAWETNALQPFLETGR